MSLSRTPTSAVKGVARASKPDRGTLPNSESMAVTVAYTHLPSNVIQKTTVKTLPAQNTKIGGTQVVTITTVNMFANAKELQEHERALTTRSSQPLPGPRVADGTRKTIDLSFLKNNTMTRTGQVHGTSEYTAEEKTEIGKRLFEDPALDRPAAAWALRVNRSTITRWVKLYSAQVENGVETPTLRGSGAVGRPTAIDPVYAAAAHQVLVDRAIKMKSVKEGSELRAILVEAVQLSELKNFGAIHTTDLTNSKTSKLLAQVRATLVTGRDITTARVKEGRSLRNAVAQSAANQAYCRGRLPELIGNGDQCQFATWEFSALPKLFGKMGKHLDVVERGHCSTLHEWKPGEYRQIMQSMPVLVERMRTHGTISDSFMTELKIPHGDSTPGLEKNDLVVYRRRTLILNHTEMMKEQIKKKAEEAATKLAADERAKVEAVLKVEKDKIAVLAAAAQAAVAVLDPALVRAKTAMETATEFCKEAKASSSAGLSRCQELKKVAEEAEQKARGCKASCKLDITTMLSLKGVVEDMQKATLLKSGIDDKCTIAIDEIAKAVKASEDAAMESKRPCATSHEARAAKLLKDVEKAKATYEKLLAQAQQLEPDSPADPAADQLAQGKKGGPKKRSAAKAGVSRREPAKKKKKGAVPSAAATAADENPYSRPFKKSRK